VTATQNTNSISLTGGSLSAGASCNIQVNVTGTAAGAQNNTVGGVSSLEGGTGTGANASVFVMTPPAIGKQFSASPIQVGGTVSLTFTITDPAANGTNAVSGLSFTDALPAGLTVANGSSAACGGIATISGGNTISLTGGSATGAVPCQFTVTVTGAVAGSYTNTTGTVSSTNAGTGNTASAPLSVVNASLGGSIGVKSGPLNARVWPVVIGNNGPGVAQSARVSSFVLQQTLGAACTPVIAGLPAIAGDIAAGGTANANVTIDFTGCSSTAFFKVTIGLSADNGGVTASIVKLNQLP
jgi:uncharacterized repeat protein (TIGR01451 family)